MGVDDNQYIGPYVQCENEMKMVVASCETKDCPLMENGQYKKQLPKHCSECGRVTKAVNVPTLVKSIEFYEYASFDDGGLDDNLTLAESACGEKIIDKNGKKVCVDTYIPNTGDHGKMIDPADSLTEVYDLQSLNPEQEIKQFKLSFAKELEVIEKAYGKYEISWGLVLWPS